MGDRLLIISLGAFLLWTFSCPALPSELSVDDRILAAAEKVRAAFQEIEDYSCEVEQIYFQNGSESQRYHFNFYFKKKRKIRIDFINPHPGITILYNDKDEEVTVIPFRFLPGLKFQFPIKSSIVQTPTGQRIDQTDLLYFIDFLFKNLAAVPQKESEFQEEKDQVKFFFSAIDYLNKKNSVEKYQIFISKKSWLPIRIERYTQEGQAIEFSSIHNYILNAHLQDKFFLP